ncbi:TonB-dependent siderophore receptor [soil metagenome]
MPLVLRGIAALAAFLWLPKSPAGAQQTGTIRGLVTNQETGAPLAGALVALRGTGLRSEAGHEGRFVLVGVPAGDYTLAATYIGFTPATARVHLAGGATAEVEIALKAVAVTLREVVVTASKTETEVRDVPAAVSVLSSEAIEKSGATNFTEAVKHVPGVSAASFGENFQSIQLRGLPRLSNENETVLILLDGVPQTDARNSSQLMTLPIGNVDRVEVVKGPNSALYGRTAIGGVVNVITREPPAEPEFRARFQGGQWDFIRGELSAGGPLSRSGQSGYLVSWLGSRHETFHDTPVDRRESSLFGKVTTPLDSVTRTTFSVSYTTDRGGTPAPVPLIDGVPLSDIDPRFSRWANINVPSARYDEEHIRLTNKVGRPLGAGVEITNTFGYRHSLYTFVDDGDFLSPPAAGSDTVVLFPFSRPREENAYFNDLRLQMDAGPERLRHRLLLGGTIDRNTGTVSTTLPYSDSVSFGVPVSYLDPQHPPRESWNAIDLGSRSYAGTFYGLYLQDEIIVARRLHLTLGARYDHNSVNVTPSGGDRIEASFDKLSPKVGASYRLVASDDPAAPQVNVYGQYSRAFKPPAAPAELQVALDPNQPLTPENITNYEAGVKASLWGGRATLEGSVFDMTRDGIPILLRISGTQFRESSAGKQHFTGVEVGAGVRLVPSVLLTAQYAFYNGRYDDFRFVENGEDVDLTGFRVLLSPRHMVDLSADYTLANGINVNLSGKYEGSKYLDAKNSVLLDPFFTVDGRVSWQWRNYTFGLSAMNLFDEDYATDGDTTGDLFIFPAPPRRVIAEFGVAF